MWSALGVGVGVGVGLGLASPTVSKWTGVSSSSNAVTGDKLEQELARQVIDGRESDVTFAEFPYYLSDQTRVLLTSAAYVHLKHAELRLGSHRSSPCSPPPPPLSRSPIPRPNPPCYRRLKKG